MSEQKADSHYDQFDSEEKGAIKIIKTGNVNVSNTQNDAQYLLEYIKQLEKRIEILEKQISKV